MPRAPRRKAEKEYYPLLQSKLRELFRNKYGDTLTAAFFEITATRKFSPAIKSRIGRGREIIFSFLTSSPPDITGYVSIKDDYNNTGFVIAEFKTEPLELKDVYQVKRYADLFDAKHALLISLYEIPEELKRLSEVAYSLLALPGSYNRITLATYDDATDGFYQWFPQNPFTRTP